MNTSTLLGFSTGITSALLQLCGSREQHCLYGEGILLTVWIACRHELFSISSVSDM